MLRGASRRKEWIGFELDELPFELPCRGLRDQPVEHSGHDGRFRKQPRELHQSITPSSPTVGDLSNLPGSPPKKTSFLIVLDPHFARVLSFNSHNTRLLRVKSDFW